MGFNDRMDSPECYGAQYDRDYGYGRGYRTAYVSAEERAEAQAACQHDSSRPAGDGLEECIDCGETFVPAGSRAQVA